MYYSEIKRQVQLGRIRRIPKSKSGNAKIAGENNVECVVFMMKLLFITICTGKHNANGKFYKEATG
jgi:hypothetical protein